MTFNELYQAHYEQIYRFCFRFVGDADQAADLCQDTFLKLYNRMNMPSHNIDNIRAWLYKVAGNLCVNAVAKKNNRTFLLNDNQFKTTVDQNPELAFIANETKEILRLAMEQFGPKQRMLLLMYQDGLSYKEMAEATEIPLNSVGKTLWRSIEKLSEMIKKQDHE